MQVLLVLLKNNNKNKKKHCFVTTQTLPYAIDIYVSVSFILSLSYVVVIHLTHLENAPYKLWQSA